jgi:Rrf2 family protein
MVNISAKTEYACIAIVDLAAEHASGEPVRLKSIAERHGIPSRFLVQIMLQLKSAGLVNSIRGASGGYQLNRDPASISLGEVMRVIEGGESGPRSNLAESNATTTALLRVWNEVHASQNEILDNVAVSELAAEARATGGDMYYI